MKILHTADWHIGQFKGPVVDGVNLRSQDTVKCLEYMVQVAIEEKPDIVCVSGDIFHQEQVGPVRYSDEMITATNIITSLAHFSKYVIVMRGTPNHDGAAQFRVLERMLLNIRNVDVVTEPGVIKTPWADIACLPGFDKQEFRAKFPGLSADEENLAWTKYISDMVFALRAECEKTPILMAHYTVPGCNMESGQTSFFTNFEPVIPREALMAARYEAVLLGHIHRPQIIEGFDNVFYSGAINAMNFNDEGQERGFWIHEFNEKGTLVKGHRYTTPYRQFHTITWDPDEVGDYIREGAMYLHRTGISEEVTDKIVRVRYSCTSEQKKALNIPLLQTLCISDLGAMVPTAAKFGLAAAAVTAAVVGIGVAVDNYNQKALSSNLEEHFGNIKLSAQEVQDIASGILDQKYLANVEVALNEVKNADKLREDAQKALESNDVLEFKSRVGIKLTTEEQEDYTSNIETFVKSKIEELESRTFAAHIHVQTYLGGTEEGQTLAQNIEKWATADYVELDGLSSQLSQKVSEALKDGIIDADEEGAISALQEKMNSITARWKESEAQAKWDWINQEYGSLNAADLESGSFTDLLGAMRDQRQSAKESVQADVEQWYSELNSMQSAGRITSAQNKQYHEMTGWYVKGQEGNELSKSLQLGSNTLNSAYAEKIQSNRQSLAENTQYTINTAQSQLEQLLQLEHPEEGNVSALTSALMYGFNEFGNGKVAGVGPVIDKDQNALSTMYESMKPDVTQMQGLIDDYREAGKAVPQSLMDSFNDAIEVGAAAGDTSATWQNYANQIWKNGSDELKASLTDPSNPMYETVRSQLPPELAEAIDRAAAETTTEDVTLEGLKASVDGDVDIDKDAWTSKLNEALGDLGETQEVTADHVKIKVDQGDCLWEIGNALGIDWQTIAEQNGIESPYIIHPDQELTISMDTLTAEVDGDKAQAAIEQAMSALDAEGAEMSVTAEGVKVDLANVEVDSDTAAAQIEAALGMESGTLAANGIEVQAGASVTIPSELVTVDTSGMKSATEQAAGETETEPIEQEASANVNVTNTTTDTSGMQAQAEEDAKGAVGDVPVEGSANVTFSGTTTDTSGVVEQVTADIESAVSDVPANGHASITLDQSNNAAEIYSLATADVVSAFSETIPADGHVDVTLDQTNNAAAIYSECAGQVQSTFSQGFTASADVAVTLNWHITNPSASISTSSSGSSVSATIAGHASGGEVGLNGAELSWVGEEGLEYIIPTVPARRQRGIELWKSAGRTLGVLGPDDEISAHASGGIVGKEVSNTIPYFDTDSSSQDSEKTEKETVPTNVVSDKSGVVVQVNLSPQFNISDTNDSDVIRLIKAHIKELADDLGSEIATMLSEAYENTPVTT